MRNLQSVPMTVSPMTRKLSQSFIDRMAEAAFWETYVATCLSRMGFHVMHYPTDIRADGFQKDGMYDSADLALMVDEGGGVHDGWVPVVGIEVKAWGNPPPGVLCSKSSWTKKGYGVAHGRPEFIIVNKTSGDMLWLPCDAPVTTSRWKDPARDYSEDMVKFDTEDLLPMEKLKEKYSGLIKEG